RVVAEGIASHGRDISDSVIGVGARVEILSAWAWNGSRRRDAAGPRHSGGVDGDSGCDVVPRVVAGGVRSKIAGWPVGDPLHDQKAVRLEGHGQLMVIGSRDHERGA